MFQPSYHVSSFLQGGMEKQMSKPRSQELSGLRSVTVDFSSAHFVSFDIKEVIVE